MTTRRLIASILLLGAACARSSSSADARAGADTSRELPAAATPSEEAAIEKLKTEARALVRVDGCSASGECATIPLGIKACGSPEDYLVYCPRSTDIAALEAKVAEVERAQRAYNEKHQVMSTCEYRIPPTTAIVGGSCRAVPSTPGGEPTPR